jgi:Gene product 88
MDKTLALEITGGFSAPSKMPCYGFSIPAKKCITGMKLREVVGSICSKCYALKGRYAFANVQNALERRFAGLENPRWVEAMAFLLNKVEKSGFFRWHDSGDLQSVEHLSRIVEVCRLTPNVQHWLPTREYGFVSEYLKTNSFPANLTVRLSALMLEAAPPASIASRLGLTTSGVSKEGFTCPSSKQGGKCLDCRACWNKSVSNVNYKQH